jgi:hypothetical protein
MLRDKEEKEEQQQFLIKWRTISCSEFNVIIFNGVDDVTWWRRKSRTLRVTLGPTSTLPFDPKWAKWMGEGNLFLGQAKGLVLKRNSTPTLSSINWHVILQLNELVTMGFWDEFKLHSLVSWKLRSILFRRWRSMATSSEKH